MNQYLKEILENDLKCFEDRKSELEKDQKSLKEGLKRIGNNIEIEINRINAIKDILNEENELKFIKAADEVCKDKRYTIEGNDIVESHKEDVVENPIQNITINAKFDGATTKDEITKEIAKKVAESLK